MSNNFRCKRCGFPVTHFLADDGDPPHLGALVCEAFPSCRPTLRARVAAFHMKYGHPIASTPHVPDEAQVRFCLKLIAEEFFELLHAAGVGPGEMYSEDETAHDVVVAAIERLDTERINSPNPLVLPFNLPAFVDALGDLDYVIEGSRLVFGVDGEPIAAEIHRANMDKDPNGPDGKPVKPPGWKSPDIEGEIKKQGWKP